MSVGQNRQSFSTVLSLEFGERGASSRHQHDYELVKNMYECWHETEIEYEYAHR